MLDDRELHNMREWLDKLGCPVRLSSASLKRLAGPDMHSAWRHLQEHVVKDHTVRTAKKNLLLRSLQGGGATFVGSERIKIESIEQLHHVEKVQVVNKEILKTKRNINSCNEVLLSDIYSLAVKNAEKVFVKSELRKVREKTYFFKLKMLSIKKEIEQIKGETSMSECLVEQGEQEVFNKSTVSKILQNDCTLSDENSDELFQVLQLVPATTIVKGINLSSLNTCKKLSSFKNKLLEEQAPTNPDLNEILPLSKYLNNIYMTLITMNASHQRTYGTLNTLSSELDREKTQLINCLEKIIVDKSYANFEGPGSVSPAAFVEKLVFNEMSSKEVETLPYLEEALQAECCELSDQIEQVNVLGERKERLYKNIKEKVNVIRNFSNCVFKKKVNKDNFLSKSNQHVSISFNDIILKNPKLEDLLSVFTEVINREFKVYVDSPLTALTRKWEESFDLLPEEVIIDSIKNRELLCLLHHSDPKNILKSVLEKVYWLFFHIAV